MSKQKTNSVRLTVENLEERQVLSTVPSLQAVLPPAAGVRTLAPAPAMSVNHTAALGASNTLAAKTSQGKLIQQFAAIKIINRTVHTFPFWVRWGNGAYTKYVLAPGASRVITTSFSGLFPPSATVAFDGSTKAGAQYKY